jgi:hypothetical protein
MASRNFNRSPPAVSPGFLILMWCEDPVLDSALSHFQGGGDATTEFGAALLTTLRVNDDIKRRAKTLESYVEKFAEAAPNSSSGTADSCSLRSAYRDSRP